VLGSGVARFLAIPGQKLGTPAIEAKMANNNRVNTFNRSPPYSGLCTKIVEKRIIVPN